MDLLALLDGVTGALDDAELRYALAGALALHAHGYSRATQDVDFVLHRQDIEAAVRVLEGLGFTQLESGAGFAHFAHPLGARIDFILIDGATADEIFAAASKRQLGKSRAICTITAAHLVALKVFAVRNEPARRLREAADIQELLRLGVVDSATVKGYCDRYGQEELWRILRGEER